ncbi:MAG: TonB-dependent receptor [Acidobacteriaceae bacterium]|nr:TonB-dependent receptor [Acidobacteriaceae bacterium]
MPKPPLPQSSVTVSAQTDRGLANINDAATSVAVVSQQQMQQSPGLTLDDTLHSVAGFQLFRRTSSWSANPTTQGVSLRGLGSTAASRTLVVSDEVPLNDAFGGWVHWNEIPALAIARVELLRGGASDLYGSSAIGGVINVLPRAATVPWVLQLEGGGATENTGVGDALLSGGSARWGAVLGALSVLSTQGYVPIAPALRGTVDRQANVQSEAARIHWQTPLLAGHYTAFLRGNLMNESRGNGTVLQTNATRLWRYQGGGDAGWARTTAALRVYGAREGYRQSFTSIAADRDAETLTRLQRVPADEMGVVVQASRAVARNLTVAAGFDARDTRATDAETPVATGKTVATSARQRASGGYIDGVWQPRAWSLSASVRVDRFRTFDANALAANVRTALPEVDELVASPRVGIVRQIAGGLSLTATAFRAFRGPTLNELYRTGQVGSQTTLANNMLLSERATGFELGGELVQVREGKVRATYFWTEVNRPISAVVLSQSATAQTLQRQNLGQIRSRGMMLEAQSVTWHGFDASFGYQLAIATVTAFRSDSPAQANLTGKWTPQVPRQSVTVTANYAAAHVASFHLIASYQGMQFDDAANQFVLHPYARFDLSADRTLRHGFSLYAGAQNLLNRSIDAGRTPTLTLASPRLVQGGLRYTLRH